MENIKIPAITLCIGLAVGYFLLPHKTKIETKEVIKTVVQEVVKIKTDVRTRTVTVKVPGGTETTTTETVDNSVTDTALNSTQESVKEKIVSQNGVSIGVYALSDVYLTKPDYGILLDIPLASKASIFFTGDTAKRVGAGIRLQF
jgi:hypothetical protein